MHSITCIIKIETHWICRPKKKKVVSEYSLTMSLDNGIKEIKGIEKCQRLQNLSLAHNKIDRIQGLDNLPIQYLNLVSMSY